MKAKKKQNLMGRPMGRRSGEPILEDSIFTTLLNKQNLQSKDFWEMYTSSGLEERAKIQRLPSEDGSVEFIPRDEVETVESTISQSGFRDWFTRWGMKFHRFVNLLSLLKLKVVIVPYHAKVEVTSDSHTVKCDDVGENNISLFSYNLTEDYPILEYESISLPKEKVLLRKARPKKNETENKKDTKE